MGGWHHRLDGHESEQTLGDSEGKQSLVCSSPWGCKELDTTEQLKNSNNSKRKMHLNVYSSTGNSQDVVATQVPINR